MVWLFLILSKDNIILSLQKKSNKASPKKGRLLINSWQKYVKVHILLIQQMYKTLNITINGNINIRYFIRFLVSLKKNWIILFINKFSIRICILKNPWIHPSGGEVRCGVASRRVACYGVVNLWCAGITSRYPLIYITDTCILFI